MNNSNLTEKRRIGNLGEDIACIYLEKQGFKIKDRNYLRKYGEIDIVAEKDRIIHFIEVKTVSREAPAEWDVTRRTDGEYKAEDNIHPWKLKRLSRVIQAYILDKRVKGEWQFDVMTVILYMETRKARVSFMENIVL
jgi:putative endonuclease